MNPLFQFVSEIRFNFALKWLSCWWGQEGLCRVWLQDRQHLQPVFSSAACVTVWCASWEKMKDPSAVWLSRQDSQHLYCDSSTSPLRSTFTAPFSEELRSSRSFRNKKDLEVTAFAVTKLGGCGRDNKWGIRGWLLFLRALTTHAWVSP